MGVHADSVASGNVNIGDASRTWHEVLRGILGIDTALNGMAFNPHILLADA